jgi:hypothetical protein
MAMVGHRTESMYRRYAIVDEMILRESAERLVAFYVGSHRRRRSSHCGRPASRKRHGHQHGSQPERN